MAFPIERGVLHNYTYFIIICFIKKLNELIKNNLKQVRDIRMRVLKAAKYKFL